MSLKSTKHLNIQQCFEITKHFENSLLMKCIGLRTGHPCYSFPCNFTDSLRT